VKKAYAKVKAQENATQIAAQTSLSRNLADTPSNAAPSSLELHPDRQAMLEEEETNADQSYANEHESRQYSRVKDHSKQRRAKPSGYAKEMEVGAQRKAEVEKRQKAMEARKDDRKAMSKAKRPSRDGKLKLGRQGTVLLGRIRRLTEEGKI
jgi:hypothetical protein